MFVLRTIVLVLVSALSSCSEIICGKNGWSVRGGEMGTYLLGPSCRCLFLFVLGFFVLSPLFSTLPHEAGVIILIYR